MEAEARDIATFQLNEVSYADPIGSVGGFLRY